MSDEPAERDRGDDADARDATDAREDLTDAEKDVLHEMQVGIEHVGRARGRLLDFHHEIGRACDRFESARETLREAGYDELADELRDRHLPAGVIGDRWTFELVTDFEEDFYADVTEFENDLREELADGKRHVRERDVQSEWRRRAGSEAWKGECGVEKEEREVKNEERDD